MGEEHRRPGVFEHEGEAVLGVGDVKREISATRLKNAEYTDDEIKRTLDAKADNGIRADSGCAELAGEMIGAPVQFTITE